ncbi:L-rhamnose/proton symporter RhaT [Chryseobacterium indoltheticum]|uniref:L-rhamnose/proton symporter RhaT n=1 Tax=Chryseobacterium indoltheticum TaxID=254 RepID=UPI003F492764
MVDWRCIFLDYCSAFGCILTIPNFWEIIQNESSSILGLTFLFGALWGIGGFMYGLGVRYLGVALGSSISWDLPWLLDLFTFYLL